MIGAPARRVAQPSPGAARIALAAFAALGAAVLLDPGAPPPAPADAPAESFSAARAFEHLREIAREPHMAGTWTNARVRAYLAARLAELDVPFEEQTWKWNGFAGTRRGPFPRASGLEVEGVNLLARLPARTPSPRVALFVAHYDARGEREVDGAPGAGDDGAAVAAFLEVLRVLKLAPPPKNELWFLFTDGEELGLLGAEEFARRPGALERVALVLNFEGRGNGGPAILFETGRDDAALLREYAACVPWPMATSLGPSVYERMPNDTDFSVFKRRGLPGLNFAFIGGGSAYHTPADTPENLDPRSLQHHGSTALALARRLGEVDLDELSTSSSGRATFFTLPGNVLVTYPGAWDAWVGLLAVSTVAAVLTAGVRGGVLRVRGLALAALGWPVFAAVLLGALLAGWWLLDACAGLLREPLPTRGNLASGTLAVLGLNAWGAFLLMELARRAPVDWLDSLAAGTALAGCALVAGTLVFASGASHVLAWPLFFAALGLHASLRTRARRDAATKDWIAVWVLVVPGLLLLLPVSKLLHQAGSVRPWVGAAATGALLAVAGGLFLPQLERITRPTPRTALSVAGLAGIAFLLGSSLLFLAGR